MVDTTTFLVPPCHLFTLRSVPRIRRSRLAGGAAPEDGGRAASRTRHARRRGHGRRGGWRSRRKRWKDV